MRFHRLNNVVHRDLGFFLVGTTILYALSGLAMNHVDDWNPNFIIRRQEVHAEVPESIESVNRPWVLEFLEPLGEKEHYRSHDFPTPEKLKVYLDEGSILVDLKNGQGLHESVKRRPVFYQMNCLHLSPEQAWLFFSDIFAVSLIIVAVTGLFVLKGRKGIKGRGAIFAVAGVVVPMIFLFLV